MSAIQYNLSEIISSELADDIALLESKISSCGNDEITIVCDIPMTEALENYIKWLHLTGADKTVSFMHKKTRDSQGRRG